jgi:hypothetical protein
LNAALSLSLKLSNIRVYSLPAKKEVDPNKGEAPPSQAQSALLKIRISTITRLREDAVKNKLFGQHA